MNTDPTISTFPSAKDTACGPAVTISQLAEMVRNPEPDIKAKIKGAREHLAGGRKKKFDSIKRTLPAVTLSGSFFERNADSLEEHSGLLSVDVDKLTDAGMTDAWGELTADPHVVIAFRSPSGNGIKGALRVPVAEDGTGHLEAFQAAERYFEEVHGLLLDKSGKDVCRLCFLSHDPEAHLNLEAVALDIDQWRPLSVDEKEAARIRELLEAASFKGLATPPPNEPPILTNDREDNLGEAGNLIVIQGQMKSGKTGVISGIMAALISDPKSDADCLGFVAQASREGFILHFDCEQGPQNHYRLMQNTVAKRAGLGEVPDCLKSFSLLKASLGDRWAMVEAVTEQVSKVAPLRCVIFDGGADFLATLNDEAAANEMVERQFRFAIEHHCLVVIVLHENPGTDNGKTRGHYGSQLHRKMQAALVVEKGADEISAVYGHPLRDGYWPRSEAHFFKYDTMRGMHVSCCDPTEERKRIKEAGKRAALRSLVEKVLPAPIAYTRLLEGIIKAEACSESTAKNRFKDMKHAGLITQNGDGNYEQGQ